MLTEAAKVELEGTAKLAALQMAVHALLRTLTPELKAVVAEHMKADAENIYQRFREDDSESHSFLLSKTEFYISMAMKALQAP